MYHHNGALATARDETQKKDDRHWDSNCCDCSVDDSDLAADVLNQAN